MPSKPDPSIDRRSFFSEATAGCCCMALVAAEQAVSPSPVSAQTRRRGGVNPMLTPVAVCGLFCGACGGLQDTVKSDGTKQDGCLGCKSDMLGGHCKVCKVRACAKEKNIANCGLCADYPCDKVKEYHNDEKEGTYMALARKNTEDFRYFGNDPEWSEKQLKRWSCPKCNTPFAFTSKECPKCDARVATVEVEAAVYAKRKTPSFVDFDGRRWQDNLAYKTETKTQAGKKTLQVLGSERTIVFLPDVEFTDGTIECDLAVRTSGGLAFHVNEDGTTAELVQLRFLNTAKDRNKKLLLYCRHEHWLTGWRELRREHPGLYEAETKLAKDKWFHLKLVIKGKHLEVFLDEGEEPVLTVEKRLGKSTKGFVGLFGEDARFANVTINAAAE